VSVQSSKAIHDLSAPVLADYASALPAQVAQRATRHRALSLKRQAGQGMTEYIIIVALVAVAAIAVYQYLGQVLRAQTAAVAKELAGEDGTQQSRAAQSAAESAATQAAAKSLKDFTGQAQGSSR
jgi:Flp pilus assembly pilin Flp